MELDSSDVDRIVHTAFTYKCSLLYIVEAVYYLSMPDTIDTIF